MSSHPEPWSVKRILKRVPQPYKTWLARLIFFPLWVLFAAVAYTLSALWQALIDLRDDLREAWVIAKHW